jgi:hypothetical protein
MRARHKLARAWRAALRRKKALGARVRGYVASAPAFLAIAS